MRRLLLCIVGLLIGLTVAAQEDDYFYNFGWLRTLVDSIENETNWCTTCSGPPEIKSYNTAQGALLFRLKFACDDLNTQRFYDARGDLLGVCELGEDARDCDDFSLTTGFTFGRNIELVWDCDVGYNCAEVAELDLFIPYEVVVSGDACDDDVRILSVTASFEAYEWMTPDSSITTEERYSVINSGKYRLVVTDPSGCQDTSEIQVDVAVPINIEIIGKKVICSDPVVLSLPGYDEYQWSTGASTPSIEVDMAGEISVTVSNAQGCSETISVDIEDHRQRSIVINHSYQEVYVGQRIDLALSLQDFAPSDIAEIRWLVNDELVQIDNQNLSFQLTESATINASLISHAGCLYEDALTMEALEVNKEYYVPNVIYPKSNSGNGVFFFQGIEGTIVLSNMMIYDRWGMPVYNNVRPDLNDVQSGWDGTKKGVRLPMGNYVYSVQMRYANGEEEQVIGTILLIQ